MSAPIITARDLALDLQTAHNAFRDHELAYYYAQLDIVAERLCECRSVEEARMQLAGFRLAAEIQDERIYEMINESCPPADPGSI